MEKVHNSDFKLCVCEQIKLLYAHGYIVADVLESAVTVFMYTYIYMYMYVYVCMYIHRICMTCA